MIECKDAANGRLGGKDNEQSNLSPRIKPVVLPLVDVLPPIEARTFMASLLPPHVTSFITEHGSFPFAFSSGSESPAMPRHFPRLLWLCLPERA